jgi:PAS domain S-box-containing protein
MAADGTIVNYLAGTDSDLYVSPDVFIGRRMQDIMPPEVGRKFDKAVRESLLSGSPAVIEYTLPMPGGPRVYEARLMPLVEGQVFAIVRNITGQKRVEDALRQTQHRLLKAQQIAHMASWEWDVAGDEVSFISDAFNDYFGPVVLPDHSFHTILHMIHPQDRENFERIVVDTIADKDVFSLDHRIQTREGEVRYVHTEGEIVRDALRRPLKVIGIAQDITERKLIEEALRESEEKFRVLSDSSPFGILVTQNDKIVYANPTVINVSGYSEKECRHMDYFEAICPEYRDLARKYAAARLQGGQAPTRYEFSFRTKSGEEKWIDCSPIVIQYNGKQAILMTLIDITARKAGEKALKESKAEAELYLDLMGHDINNMNMIAMGNIEYALGQLQAKGGIEDEDRALLEKSIETLQGASRLIGNVRKLRKERMGGYKTNIVDLDSVLREAVADYSSVPGREVAIGLSSAPLCRVQANELLKDVFLNLLGNAIKHSSGPLRIDIAVTRTSSDGIDHYMVTIDDTGPGIPDDRKRWLMGKTSEPVPGGASRGFGLRLVKALVDDFQGILRLEDRVPGDYTRGSRFVVLLPAVKDDGR